MPLIQGVVIIFSLSLVVILICNKLRIAPLVGYLITGMLAGPYGFELIKEVHQVEVLSEIGIILLLFTIGIEFSMGKLLELKKAVLLGGFLQLMITAAGAFLWSKVLNLKTNQSIFVGLLVALSSTAIVLKLIQERGEINSPHGRASIGILIFQDIAVVPMMFFIPILAGDGGDVLNSLLKLGFKAALIVLLIIVSAKWIVPRFLYLVVKTRIREIFLLSIVLICLLVAWITSEAGLSLALGAFLAGLIISESEYSYEALGNILPFRYIFSSFFFVSIGMLLNVEYVGQKIILIIEFTLGVIILKTFAAALSGILTGFPLRSALLLGFSISQIGEFSFILAKSGEGSGLISGDYYNLFLAVSVITMALTPLIIELAPKLAYAVMRLPFPERLKNGSYYYNETADQSPEDHLVIVGFGVNGRNVSRAAEAAQVSHIIIEMNPDLVREEKLKGTKIMQGDASQEAVLKHAGIIKAKILVVAISDPSTTRRVIEIARRLNEKIYIIVRAKYIKELEHLYSLGANEVIPEEYETSIEIFTRVLNKYLIPKEEIEIFSDKIRAEGYEIFRNIDQKTNHLLNLNIHIPDIDMYSLRVAKNSQAEGKTLNQIALRKEYKVTALAIRRGGNTILNPQGDDMFLKDDIVILVGLREKLATAEYLFK